MSKKKKTQKSSKKFTSIIDPITGEKINSDSVYGPESTYVQKLGGGQLIEWELNKNVLIATNVGLEEAGQIQRRVFLGDFTVSKKGDLQGSINHYAIGDYFPTSAVFAESETISVDKITGRSKFRNSAEFMSLEIPYAQAGSNIYFYGTNLMPYDLQTMADKGIVVSADKGALPLNLSRFFSGNWWADPFGSNLV
jgi:hypothetical protein